MSEQPPILIARDLGVAACYACGAVLRFHARHDGRRCPRCGATLHRRKPNSIVRTWALLIAAIVLYIPANLLPIMRTGSLGSVAQDDTILSGVVELWVKGSPDLSIIVFVASIVVPMVKIAILAFLLISAQRRSTWARRGRTRLYRLVEFVGHWSMLDIFVVALMTGVVRFQSFAEVTPRPGAIAFGAVVVLTMLASRSFDPRLIWDTDVAQRPAAERKPT